MVYENMSVRQRRSQILRQGAGWGMGGDRRIWKYRKTACAYAFGFHAKIMVYDPYCSLDSQDRRITVADSMEQVFAQCDYISLHIPLVPETEKKINKEYFSLMKENACLINTSRGGIIDEADLLDALKSRRIGAAGLDVIQEEPLSPSNPFLQLDNALDRKSVV